MGSIHHVLLNHVFFFLSLAKQANFVLFKLHKNTALGSLPQCGEVYSNTCYVTMVRVKLH